MGVSSFSRRLLKRYRERAPDAHRQRRPAPLSVRGLEKRIVLDAAIAVTGGSVDISGLTSGTNLTASFEAAAIDLDGDSVKDDVYRFDLDIGGWNDGFSLLFGEIDLDGNVGAEAYVDGSTLYVSAQFLETNAGGLSVSSAFADATLVLTTDITTAGDQQYDVNVQLQTDVALTGPSIAFHAGIDGSGFNLTVDGNAVFGDDAADTVASVSALHVTGTTLINTALISTDGTQTYNGDVTIGPPAGITRLETTNDAVLFGVSVTLASDVTIESGTGDVTFTGAIDGGHALTVNSAGATILGGLVGGGTSLTAVTTDAGGTTQVNGGGVHTSGDQVYNDDVQLGPGLQSFSGDSIHFLEEVDGAAGGQGDLRITNTGTVTFDKAIGSVNDLASFRISAADVTFGAGTSIDVTGSGPQSVHIVATGTLVLPANFTVRAAWNGLGFDGIANTFTPRPDAGVPGSALVELPAVPPTFSSTSYADGSVRTEVSLQIGHAGEKGLRVYLDWGNGSDPANRYEGPDGWADGDGFGANTNLDAIDGGSTLNLTHTYTQAEVLAQQLVDNTFDVKYAVFQHEAIVIEAARVEQAGETPVGVAGGALTVLTTTMAYAGPGNNFEPASAATSPDLANGVASVEIDAPFGGGTVAVGGGSVDLSNFIPGTSVTVTQATFDIDGDSLQDDVYAFSLNTGVWNDGVMNLSGPIDLDGLPGADAYVDGGFLYVSQTFVETNAGGLSITGNTSDPTIVLATDITTVGDQDYLAAVELQTDVLLSSGAANVTFGDTVSGSQSLTINSTGTTTFEGSVALTSLSTDAGGQTVFAAGVATVTTTAGQSYGDAVVLDGDLVMTAGVVSLAGGLTGGTHSLTIDGDAALGDSAADTLGGLSTLEVTGETTIHAASVTSSGTQIYGGNVTLLSDVELTASLVSIDGDVAGGGNGLTIDADAILGDASTDGLTNLASLEVNGTTLLNAGAVSSSGTQVYHGNVTLGSDVDLTGSVVTFNGQVIGQGNSLAVAGDAVFGNDAGDTVTGLDTLVVTGASTVNTSSVVTTGNQTYGGPVLLGVTTTLAGGLVSFHGTVNGGGRSLTVDGNAAFGDAAGDTVSNLNSLHVTGAATINTTNVSSSSSQRYDGDVILGGDTTLTASLVTFSGQVSGGGHSLEVDGDAVFGDEAADVVTGLDTLHVTGKSTINTTEIESSGAQTYDGTVTLGEDIKLTGALVTFNGQLIGAGNLLEIDGSVVFGDEAADTATGLNTLHVTGNATINTTDIESSGAQTYDGTVTLGEDVTLTGALVTFNDQVIGGGNSLEIDGNANFGDAAIDTVTGLDTLHVTGAATINTSQITSTGTQTFDGNVTLGENTTLATSLVTFNGLVSGAGYSLDIAGNAVFGNEASDTVTGLDTLHVTGDSTINTTDVSSTGSQTYDGMVTLGTNVSLTTGLVTFNGQVIGAGNSLEVDGDAIFGDSAGDTVTGLDTLHVTGASTVNISQITSTGAQTYDGNVTLGEDVTLMGALVTFNGQVIGSGNSLEVDGNAVFGNAAANTVTGLDALHVTGAANINTSQITSTGSQTFDGNVTLSTDVSLTAAIVTFNGQVLGGGNSLDINGNAVFGNEAGDTVTGLDTLHVTGTATINTSQITSTGTQTFDGNVTLGENTTLAGSLVTFNGQILGGGHALDVDGDAIFGDEAVDTVTGLTTLVVTGASTINTHTVTTSGAQTYQGAVTMGAPAGTAVLSTTNSAVLFQSTVNLQSNLTVSSGSGPVNFSGAVNGARHLVVQSTGNTTFNGAVGNTTAIQSLTTSAGGTTFLNGGSIQTSGHQTYGDAVSLGANTTLTALLVAFNGELAGAGHSLTVDGNAAFGDEAADVVTGLGSLQVTGTTAVQASHIESSGTQTYDGGVTLGEDVTLTATLVTFNGQVLGGGNSFEVDGDSIFGDEAADTVTGLDSLHVTGASTINSSSLESTGIQTYGDVVTLGTNTTLTASEVRFESAVLGGNHSLVIDGDAMFGNDASDTVSGLATLHVTGDATINTAGVSSTGEQTYDGTVTLGAGVTVIASLVTFNGQVVGQGNALEINADVIFGNAAGDTVTGLDTLLVTGSSVLNTSDVESTGVQTYEGAVTLGGDVTLTSSEVRFGSTITGGGHSLDIGGDAVFGNEAGDTVTGLDSLRVTGNTTINTSAITSSNGQSYDGTVTLGDDVTLTAGIVTFNGQVIGGNHSVQIDGNAVFGDGAGDLVTGLTTLLVTGDATITSGEVTTSGGQTYDGVVTLESNATLTATRVTFNGQVNGQNNSLEIDGDAVFGDAAGDTVTGLTALTVTGDSTILTTDVSASVSQTFGGSVTLKENATLTAPLVTFYGPLNGGGHSLTVDGDAVFGNEPGDAATGLDTLLVTGDASINVSDISSTGDQTYGGTVTLGADATLAGSLVTFLGQVNGANHSLQIDGDAVFGDSAGDVVSGLTTLRVTGESTINTAGINSSGNQTYAGSVTFGGDVMLTGALVTFEGQVIGGGNGLVINGNAVFGDEASDTVTGLTSLQVTGTSVINTTDVSSSGAQTYDGLVTLGGDVTLTATLVTFNGKVVGGGNSLEVAGNAVFGGESTDTVTGLDTLHVTGDATINTTDIESSGAQTYDGTVTLGEDVTLTGALVTFHGQVIGSGNSLEVDGNAIFGDSAGDTVTGLDTLHVTGTSTVNTSQITSTGTQTFDGNVTLGENTTLTGSLVTFNGQILGGGHALDVDGDAIFGDEAVDTVTGLTTLVVTGASTINTHTVTTSGAQTYQGAVTMGAPAGTAVLSTTNSAVLFQSTLTLQSNLTVSSGSGPVTFSGAVNGARHLVVQSTGNTTFNGAVGNTTALQSLTTSAGGTTFLNGGSVQTSGHQTYGDAVSLGANTTLTSVSGVVTFLGTVAGNGRSLAVAGNAVFGDSAGDTVTGLASLAVSGTTTINTSNVTSTGTQTYTGAVTIGAPAGQVTLTTTNASVFFGSTTTLASDLTVTTGSGQITWTGAINGPFDLVANSTGTTIFNGAVGNLGPLASLTTNAGGTTQINGGGVRTTGDQLYGDDVELGPGTQTLSGDVLHFFGGVDGRLARQGDLNITSANAVFFDKAIGAVRDPGSVKVQAVDVTFAAGTFIEVGKSAAGSVQILATGTLVLPTGFVVRAAFNGGDYDGVANTFLPRPAPGVPGTALVSLPASRPIFSSKQNLDETATGTIDLTIGNAGERGLRLFIDWGSTVAQRNRFEGPGGWADGDGRGDNDAPGDLYAIEGGSTVSLTRTYTAAELRAQLEIDNTFDVKYAVFQHEAIVIEAARVEQGAESLGTAGGPTTVLTTTMVYSNSTDPRFEPPDPSTVPDLVNGTAGIQIAPPVGSVPFEIPLERPNIAFAPNNESPPLDPLVTFQQVTQDDSSSSSPVVGRQQRFVLRLLSPDPTAPPLAEVDLPPDSFQADRLQRLFRELPDGAYEIDLLLGENTERPILRFDIRQGRPVVPQESLDGGQLRLEDIEETLKKNADPSTPDAPSFGGEVTSVSGESEESDQADQQRPAGAENSSLEVRPAVTMSSLLEWKLRRREAVTEGTLTLASRLARRACSGST